MSIAAAPASRVPSRSARASRFCWGIFALVALSGSFLAAAPSGARTGSGRISVSTQPAGGIIYLDGQASGKAPKEIEGLGPGTYFIRVELDGYRPSEAVVELSSAQNSQTIEIEMVPKDAPRRELAPIPVAESRPAPPVVASPPVVAPPPAVAPPRATPAPVAIVPPPAPPAPVRPVEPAPPAPDAPAAAAPGDVDETILRLVAAHLKSISDGDVDTYLRLCASKVDLYDEGMQSRDSIRKSRQKLKERWPVYEISNVREVTVKATDRPDVRRAAVSYDWAVSNPKTGKKASGSASDLLDFKQTGGQWLIVKARQNVDRGKARGQ